MLGRGALWSGLIDGVRIYNRVVKPSRLIHWVEHPRAGGLRE
jgi:hypothetical protein